MEKETLRKEMINRLKIIRGHVQGVEKMVEEKKECEDILVQITAIKSSIEKVGLLLVENHARECFIKEGQGPDEIEKLIKNIVLFMK